MALSLVFDRKLSRKNVHRFVTSFALFLLFAVSQQNLFAENLEKATATATLYNNNSTVCKLQIQQDGSGTSHLEFKTTWFGKRWGTKIPVKKIELTNHKDIDLTALFKTIKGKSLYDLWTAEKADVPSDQIPITGTKSVVGDTAIVYVGKTDDQSEWMKLVRGPIKN